MIPPADASGTGTIPPERIPTRSGHDPDLQKARVAPHEVLAERVQGVLAIRHSITCERHAGDSTAMLILSTRLIAWFYPRFVQWPSGVPDPRRPRRAVMARASVHDGADAIAKRLAERYRQIRAGQV